MTEATNSDMKMLAIILILVPVVIIAVIVIVLKEVGKNNDRKR